MKDPYLKPVIFSGLFIATLSIIFAPGIFLWAIIGGYLTVRLAFKSTKEVIKYIDGLLLGLLSGLTAGTCIDILTLISFNSPENKRLLIRALEKNWPKDIQAPNFNDVLPSVFIMTCMLIVLVCVVFSIIGSYIGTFISQKNKKTEA